MCAAAVRELGQRRTKDLRQMKSQAVGELGGFEQAWCITRASELLSKEATFVSRCNACL